VLVAPVTRAPAVVPKETGGSPEFPDYPFKHMPRSQIPVVSRPAHRDAGRTAAFPSLQGSALGPVARTYPLTTTIHFSGFNSAACALAFPLLRTPPLGDRTSVRLPARWLAFGRVGLIGPCRRTHWVTLTSFKGSCPFLSSLAFLGTSSVWFVPRESVLCLIEESPELAVKFMREISRRLRELSHQQTREAA